MTRTVTPSAFIAKKTTLLYAGSCKNEEDKDPREGVLIFGDEVRLLGVQANGRQKVEFRGKTGWVSEKSLGGGRSLECYFIDVGTGDSTFIVTPGGKKILIDGGLNRRALGFLAWKYRLDQSTEPLTIDLLVLSHADGDHLDGLAPIIDHPLIHVKRVIHSGVAVFAKGVKETVLGDVDKRGGAEYLTTRHSALAELAPHELSPEFRTFFSAVDRERTAYEAVDSTTPDLDIGDASVRIEVLGPRLLTHRGLTTPCLPWLGDEGLTINGNSVVLRLTHGDVSVLLPGDINRAGSEHLLADPRFCERAAAHVFKAPHHGSHDFSPELLRAVNSQIAVISSGDDRDHGHPRAAFLGAIGGSMRSAEPLVFSTEIAGNFVEVHTGSNGKDRGPSMLSRARALFKRRLHGMINVRSDGQQLFAARRVAASYAWEAYGPIAAAPVEDDE